ncbi:MAG: EAL domain-containing protein [Actinomycetales bacterium]|nr:EAL domain-containing protein [Actinomycetales bacterium]
MSDLVRELDRLESLLTYGVLGGGGPDLSDIAALAAQVCGTRSAAVGFLVEDRVEVHSTHGAPLTPIPRAKSISAPAVERGEPVVINDIPIGALDDHPFTYEDGPLRAFAAVPLVGRDGLPLGVLAVHHDAPLALDDQHIASLRVLADHVMTRLELHRLDSWGGRTLKPSSTIEPTRIRQALEAGELVPFLQPIVDLPTGTTVAVEALIRWEHPEAGVIAPGDFLPVVEASGLMLPVGRHMRQQALDALARIHRLGPATAEILLSVNISPIELARSQFAAELLDDVSARGLGPDKLVVEVTETTAFVDPVAAVIQLATLDEAGIRVALDDYGSGHSSLTRLLSLPLSAIKLDRALTSRLPEDARLGTAVASTISMARDLGLLVVAEGVETPLQADALHSMGCGYAQGWHFARATSVEDVIATLSRTAPAAPVVVPFASVPRPRTSGEPADQHRSAQACYVVDTERRILSWTAAAEQIAGYRAEEVIGRTCSDGLLWHVDRSGQVLCGDRCPLLDTITDGRERTAKVWLHHSKGHLVPVVVHASALRDNSGTVIGAVETFYDDSAADAPLAAPSEALGLA